MGGGVENASKAWEASLECAKQVSRLEECKRLLKEIGDRYELTASEIHLYVRLSEQLPNKEDVLLGRTISQSYIDKVKELHNG